MKQQQYVSLDNLGHGAAAEMFEADGGAWKNTAIATIKAWLAEKAPATKIIA